MIGNYPLRGTIQQRSQSLTAVGPVTTWQDVCTRWCRLVQVGADGRARYDQQVGERVTHRLDMRTPVLLTTDRRVLINGTAYYPIEPGGAVQGMYGNVLVREATEQATEGGS